VNLVHCSVLRRHDRREAQDDLMDLGVTSLATTEANVRAKVQATGMCRQPCAETGGRGTWRRSIVAIDHGDAVLARNAGAVFGAMPPGTPDPSHAHHAGGGR
jgi:hypothetical protein